MARVVLQVFNLSEWQLTRGGLGRMGSGELWIDPGVRQGRLGGLLLVDLSVRQMRVASGLLWVNLRVRQRRM